MSLHILGQYTRSGKNYRRDEHQICAVDSCQRKVERRDWCNPHYRRWVKYGDPTAGGTVRGSLLAWIKTHLKWEKDDCLLWPFGRTSNGYGELKYKGKMIGAHVLMCKLAHGEKPDDKEMVAHSCGKGHLGCVNPNHLRWATGKENAADKIIHGTDIKGEGIPWSKLKNEDVVEIFKRAWLLEDQATIGSDFGVEKSIVSSIKNGKIWAHITSLITDYDIGVKEPIFCSVQGCDSLHMAKGYCANHYYRFIAHGNPVAGRTAQGTLHQWILDNAFRDTEDCIVWPFWRDKDGYPCFGLNKKTVRAARYVCEQVYGPSPSKYHRVMNECGDKSCLNPKHMKWATQSEIVNAKAA